MTRPPTPTEPRTATGGLLWARAWLLAGVALLTGSFAHVQADGLLPGPLALVALTAVGAVACAPMLRRQGSTRRIVVLLVLGQSAVHVALAASAGHRGDPVRAAARPVVPTGSVSRRGSYFDVAYSAPAPAGGSGAGLHVPDALLHAVHDASAHPTMAVAHLVAAVVCGWWLARGERALWALLALAGRAWTELLRPLFLAWALVLRSLGLHRPTPGAGVRPDLPRPALRALRRSLSRRGPPRGASALTLAPSSV